MEFKRCFEPECMLDVESICKCAFPATYSCEVHARKHLKLPNRTHRLESVFVEPYAETKAVIDKSFANKNSKHRKLKDSISQNANLMNKKLKGLKGMRRVNKKDLDAELKETKNTININTLQEKTAEIVSKPSNSTSEIDFRRTCSTYESSPTALDPLLMQVHQDYLSTYKQNASLYTISSKGKRTNLHIYNTETESKEIKILKKIKQPLDMRTCIAQLPNNKLFCFGNYPISGTTLIIDESCEVEYLPSGTPCCASSCIYFNHNVYCFGGYQNDKFLKLSSRFDLDENRWIHLTPMPKADLYCCSIIFNGNILISESLNRNLLLYSIASDSFLTIPYLFAKDKRKILINSGRLYLIECPNGSIYESEIDNELAWRRIANSTTSVDVLQVYCSYNKGGVYIACTDCTCIKYFKFDLDQKSLELL